MMKTVETRLAIKSWDEKPYQQFEDGRKFTRATVQLGASDGIASARYDALMFYRADGTSSYVTLIEVTATLDGRSGTIVLRGSGTYDGTLATWSADVVAGTDELRDLSGTAHSTSTHEDYPNMPLSLSYQL